MTDRLLFPVKVLQFWNSQSVVFHLHQYLFIFTWDSETNFENITGHEIKEYLGWHSVSWHVQFHKKETESGDKVEKQEKVLYFEHILIL